MNALETDVLNAIGESLTAPDVYSDLTPVRDSINAAIQEVCLASGSYTRVYHLPLYAGRFFYRMEWAVDHFAWVVECWNRRQRNKLVQTDISTLALQDPWFLKNVGPPNRYAQIGWKYLGFDRAPSAHGDTLEITCAVIPKAYTTDSDPIKLRPVFRQAATQYAVSEFFASRGDATRAGEWLAKYLETAGMAAMKPMMPERTFQVGKGRPEWGVSTVP